MSCDTEPHGFRAEMQLNQCVELDRSEGSRPLRISGPPQLWSGKCSGESLHVTPSPLTTSTPSLQSSRIGLVFRARVHHNSKAKVSQAAGRRYGARG